MRRDAFAQVDALPDVERQRVQAVEAVDARAFGDVLERVGRELRRQARRLENARNRGIDLVGGTRAIKHLHELPQEACVAESPVPIGAIELMTLDKAVEVVARSLGIKAPRQLDRAQGFRAEASPKSRE